MMPGKWMKETRLEKNVEETKAPQNCMHWPANIRVF